MTSSPSNWNALFALTNEGGENEAFTFCYCSWKISIKAIGEQERQLGRDRTVLSFCLVVFLLHANRLNGNPKVVYCLTRATVLFALYCVVEGIYCMLLEVERSQLPINYAQDCRHCYERNCEVLLLFWTFVCFEFLFFMVDVLAKVVGPLTTKHRKDKKDAKVCMWL